MTREDAIEHIDSLCSRRDRLGFDTAGYSGPTRDALDSAISDMIFLSQWHEHPMCPICGEPMCMIAGQHVLMCIDPACKGMFLAETKTLFKILERK